MWWCTCSESPNTEVEPVEQLAHDTKFGEQDTKLGEPPIQHPDQTSEQTLRLPGGVVYVGQVDGSQQQHGNGRQNMSDGSSYEGQFQNGEMTGQGAFRSPDGSLRTGTFTNGKLDGSGE